jgi:hypothetical protein
MNNKTFSGKAVNDGPYDDGDAGRGGSRIDEIVYIRSIWALGKYSNSIGTKREASAVHSRCFYGEVEIGQETSC